MTIWPSARLSGAVGASGGPAVTVGGDGGTLCVTVESAGGGLAVGVPAAIGCASRPHAEGADTKIKHRRRGP